MKNWIIKWAVTGLVLIAIHQSMLPKVNSILLMELMGLIMLCYLRYRFLKIRGYNRGKASHFSGNRYDRPKDYKPWREYRSRTEVTPKTWVDNYEESLKR